VVGLSGEDFGLRHVNEGGIFRLGLLALLAPLLLPKSRFQRLTESVRGGGLLQKLWFL
jgi:hypothetical protein